MVRVFLEQKKDEVVESYNHHLKEVTVTIAEIKELRLYQIALGEIRTLS